MNKALGLIEFSKIPTGYYFLDKIAKGNNIDILYSATVCPGKFIALFKGDIASVNRAVEDVQGESDSLIDSFILGNPSEELYSCIMGVFSPLEKGKAIGISESFSVAAIIEAADIAIKSAEIKLCQLRLAKGMCGKSFFVLMGDVSAVKAALDSGDRFLKEKAMYIDSALISNPDENILDHFY